MPFTRKNSAQITAVAAEKSTEERLAIKTGDVVYIITYITTIGSFLYYLGTFWV